MSSRALLFPTAISFLEQFFNKALHSPGALAAHLVGDMAVDIQCKDRRGVAQVFLHGLDIVPALDRGHGVAVPQIVDPGLRAANGSHQLFEILVDGLGDQIAAQLVGKHQVLILPGGTGPQAPLCLTALLPAQQLHDIGRGRDLPYFSAFRGGQGVSVTPLPAGYPLQLLVDQQRPFVEIHAGPGEAHHLPFPQPGKQVHQVDGLEPVSLDGCQEPLDRLVIQRGQGPPGDPRKDAAGGWIGPDVSQCHSLLQRLV